MTLQEAMNYRGENPATLGDKLEVKEDYVRRWCKPGGLLKLSAVRLQVQEVRDAMRYAIARMQRAQEQSNREKHRRGEGGLD